MDESEARKINESMPLVLNVETVDTGLFEANLEFISTKSVEE